MKLMTSSRKEGGDRSPSLPPAFSGELSMLHSRKNARYLVSTLSRCGGDSSPPVRLSCLPLLTAALFLSNSADWPSTLTPVWLHQTVQTLALGFVRPIKGIDKLLGITFFVDKLHRVRKVKVYYYIAW